MAYVVRGKSGKIVGRYATQAEAERRIAQLKAGAARLRPFQFASGSPSRTEFRGPRRGHGQRTIYWTENGQDVVLIVRGPGATEWARAHHDVLGESWGYERANGDVAFATLPEAAKDPWQAELRVEYPNVKLQYAGSEVPRQFLDPMRPAGKWAGSPSRLGQRGSR